MANNDEDWGPWVNGSRADVPSIEILRLVLRHTESGDLYWMPRPSCAFRGDNKTRYAKSWNTKYAGKPAFTASDNDGYKRGAIGKRNFRAHRVIWALHTGAWPLDEIDHIDGNPANNAVSNLRECGREGNTRNTVVARGSSAFRGVQKKPSGKYAAKIRFGGKQHHIGTFVTEVEAANAYAKFAKEHHGEFSSRGLAILQQIANDVTTPIKEDV